MKDRSEKDRMGINGVRCDGEASAYELWLDTNGREIKNRSNITIGLPDGTCFVFDMKSPIEVIPADARRFIMPDESSKKIYDITIM